MDQDGPDTPEQDLFSEKLAQDLANLDLLCENSNDLSKSNSLSCLNNTANVAVDPVQVATPIPGFIITDRNVLLRRHSSAMNDTPKQHCSNDDIDQSRNILSAPPSIVIAAASPSEAGDIQNIEEDTPQQDATKVVCRDFFDDFESEEDLINESFCKYFEEAPNIYTPEGNDEFFEIVPDSPKGNDENFEEVPDSPGGMDGNIQGIEEDTPQEDATMVVCRDFFDDFSESEEDLINDSFGKYFEEVPNIYTPEGNDEFCKRVPDSPGGMDRNLC